MKKCKVMGLILVLLLVGVVTYPTSVFAEATARSSDSGEKYNSLCQDAIFNRTGFFKAVRTTGDRVGYRYGDIKETISLSAQNGTWYVKFYWDYKDEFDYDRIVSAKAVDAGNSETYTSDEGEVKSFEYKAGENKKIEIPLLNKKTDPKTVIIVASLKGKISGNKIVGYDKNGHVLYLGGRKKITCKPNWYNGSDHIEVNKNSNTYDTVGTVAIYNEDIVPVTSKTERSLVPAGWENDKDLDDSIKAEYKERIRQCELLKNALNDNGKDAIKAETPEESRDKKAKYVEYMKKALPICFDGGSYYSAFDIDSKTIKKVRKKSLEAFPYYYEYEQNKDKNDEYNKVWTEQINGNTDPEEPGKEVKWYDVKYSGSGDATNLKEQQKLLQCDRNQTTEKTARFYARKEDNSNSACTINTIEQVKVTYDPPRSIKAKECFPYKATIKSRVTTGVTYKTGKISWPDQPGMCSYSPTCESQITRTQAGPSQQFDNCINSCDNGSYTQKCINSCYKKVYKKGSNKNNKDNKDTTVNNSSKSSVGKMSNTSHKNDPYYSNNKCNSASKIEQNVKVCASYFYKVKQQYPLGKFYPKSSAKGNITHQWKPCYDGEGDQCTVEDENEKEHAIKVLHINSSDRVIESLKRAAPFYLRSKEATVTTIMGLFGKDNGRKYQIDDHQNGKTDDGIKRLISNGGCRWTCGFKADIDNEKVEFTPGGQKQCIDDNKTLRKYYEERFNYIINTLKGCTVDTKCKEGNAKFKLKVTPSINNKKLEDDSYEGTNKSINEDDECKNGDSKLEKVVLAFKKSADLPDTDYISKPITDGLDRLKETFFIPLKEDQEGVEGTNNCTKIDNGINGKCYGKAGGYSKVGDNKKYWQHYKTTISFPKTYTEYKNGQRSIEKTNESLDRGNEYCTTADYHPVNQAWWMERNQKEGCSENFQYVDLSGIPIVKDDNIKAEIEKFGQFNWKLNVSCFYAISNSTCIPKDDGRKPFRKIEQDSKESKEIQTTKIYDMAFRPIDSKNVFPAKTGNGSGTVDKLEQKDVPFNWQSTAQDKMLFNNSKGYNINPWDYKKEIESGRAESYGGKPEYYIKLTRDNINKIKDLTKDEGYSDLRSFKGSYKPMKDNNQTYGYCYESKFLNRSGPNYISEFERNAKICENNTKF